jgi:hypothetical protein
MRDAPTSSKASRFSNIHFAISAFAAIAGVVFAAIQTLSLGSGPAPINVTLALEPLGGAKPEGAGAELAKTNGAGTVNIAAKGDGDALLAPAQMDAAAFDLSNSKVVAALKDGSDARYRFRDLFDGRPETYITYGGKDHEINMLVDLGGTRSVAGIEYAPPDTDDGKARANTLDVMVLPEGAEASGRQVLSFALQTAAGRQTYALPAKSTGKYIWLRVAGPDGAGEVSVGDFRVLRDRP